jgi:sialic acid synthase SpsE|tara:strand:+ start:244 stop:474 length:231 start_codon:yes stop_codon:yes gene_type:complete
VKRGSLVFYRLLLEEMKKCDMLIAKNLCIVRSGPLLSPKYNNILLGRTLSQEVNKETALSWEWLVSNYIVFSFIQL